MQKLLRPSSSAPIICTVGSPSLSLCLPTGIHNLAFQNPKFFHSVGASSAFLSHSSSRLPTMAVFTSSRSSLATSPISKKPFTASSALSSRYLATLAASSSSCCTCRCAINHRALSRAWVVAKDGRGGPRAAWLHSGSDGSSFSASAQATSNSDNYAAGDSGEEGKSTASLPSSEEKPSKLNKRLKGSSSSSCDISSNPDLLTIPGVGPRNLRKLVDKGFAGVAELKQLYKDKFSGKPSDTMVEYLQSSVGIIHKNHAESITTFIKKSVDEESEDNSSVLSPLKDRITFCVEGNISVGKTTFLQRIANETIELRDLVEVVPEPIDKWQNVGPDHFNILDAFYAEPQRYAYTFQNYVFVTRVMQERESSGGIKPLRLMERSVFSDRMVFVRSVHEANWMNEMEISIYDSWFDPVVSCLPGLIPDGFIYLRASPDTCHKRMMLRKRAEEGGVTLDYLHSLHEKHESWLFPSQSGNHGVLSISKLPLHIDNSLHPDIRDRVFYLEGDHMHSSIQKVPALVLDCEPNIDFSKDIEAKKEYARQVAEFFEFVKKRKENTPKEAGEGNRKSQPQVLLPQSGGLWVPDGKHFPPSALKSLEFRRAMSSFISGG